MSLSAVTEQFIVVQLFTSVMSLNSSAPSTAVKSDWTLLRILIALKERGGGGVTEISEEFGLAKSTVHDHLRTLHDAEFVVKKDNKYYVGLRFLDFGEVARQQRANHELIREKVNLLAEQTGERAQFIVEEHGHGIYLDLATGDQAVQTNARTGKRVALNASSAGKSILAHLPRERVEGIIEDEGLSAETPDSITDVDTLFEELERIRERGYAVNREESVVGLHAVGAPIKGSNGTILGGLSISGPAHRLKGEWFNDEIPNILLGAVNEIELNIAFP